RRGDRTRDGSDTTQQIEQELEEMDIPPTNITTSGDDSFTARYNTDLTQEQVTGMQERFSDLYGDDPMISTVSPVIGKELAKNAIISLSLEAVGIILTESIRFVLSMSMKLRIA